MKPTAVYNFFSTDTNKVTLEKLNEKLFDKTEEIFSDIEKAVKFRKVILVAN